MNYVVKVDGEKVRMFSNLKVAEVWANRYCRGNVTIVKLGGGIVPKASDTKVKPNLDMPDLRYKPFEFIG